MDAKCEFVGEDWVGLICLGEVLRGCVFGLHFWKRKVGGGGERRNCGIPLQLTTYLVALLNHDNHTVEHLPVYDQIHAPCHAVFDICACNKT
jgi:alpha-D-ribose 1-methylphosphonate 5-triphosphate synthase subunit PhnG